MHTKDFMFESTKATQVANNGKMDVDLQNYLQYTCLKIQYAHESQIVQNMRNTGNVNMWTNIQTRYTM